MYLHLHASTSRFLSFNHSRSGKHCLLNYAHVQYTKRKKSMTKSEKKVTLFVLNILLHENPGELMQLQGSSL